MRTYKERTERIEKGVKKERAKRMRVGIVSATSCALAVMLAFAVSFNLFLFVPYTTGTVDLSAYQGSEYYSVIEKLAPLTYPAPVTKNNFDRWDLGGKLKDTAMRPWGWEADAPASPDGSGGAHAPGASAPGESDPSAGAPGGKYEEVTNNQVDGVIEGDLFKRSSDTLFYLTAMQTYCPTDYKDNVGMYVLRAYSIAGDDSGLISEVAITPDTEHSFRLGNYGAAREMFLSEDCKTVTVLIPCYDYNLRTKFTAIITVDVEKPDSMSVISTQYVSGDYVSSRMQSGTLLLVNNFSVYARPNFADEFAFLPSYGTAGDLKPLPVENIYLPENATRANYTVLATFDMAEGSLIDAEALLSFSNEVYVSQNNVYTTNEHTETREITFPAGIDLVPTTDTYSISLTEITRIAYEGGMLEVGASQTVEGTIKDRYSMDEYNGQFRVFTTAPAYREPAAIGTNRHGTSANLYVMDCDTMDVLAESLRFCPEGESVQSARFDGNTAYVCTALVQTLWACDPVYIFDLSDLANINSKDTGEIAGFSSSLVTFKNGTLLGIGYADGRWSGRMKIEIYGETEDAVESIASVEMAADFSENFKAYFIDKEEGLVGLGVLNYSNTLATEYLLLRFDGYELLEILRVEIGSDYEDMRAFYDDGYFYIVHYAGLNVQYIG